MTRKIKYCPVCRTSLKRRKLDGRSRLLCPECGWVRYENPFPSAVALVRNSKGEILLVKRGVEPHKGRWALPSGFIEADETPEEACCRELKEETNLDGRVLRLIGVYSEQTKLYGRVLLIAYVVKPGKGKVVAGSDTKGARFFSAEKLPAIPLSSHRQIIKDTLDRGGFSKPLRQVLKSKVTKAVIKKTKLFYEGSIGIDAAICEKADILSGEKVDVLNYNNGERFETYVIKERRNSGAIVLYGPAARKGRVGDEVCVLSYVLADSSTAKEIEPKTVYLDEENRVK